MEQSKTEGEAPSGASQSLPLRHWAQPNKLFGLAETRDENGVRRKEPRGSATVLATTLSLSNLLFACRYFMGNRKRGFYSI